MRKVFLTILIIICVGSIHAQNYRLIEAKHISDGSKNLKNTGNCIAEKFILNDTVHLTIFADLKCRDLSVLRDSFSIYHDTLSLNFIDTTGIKYFVWFNKAKNKNELNNRKSTQPF